MHKLTNDRMKWGQCGLLGGLLVAGLLAGALRYDGVDRVVLTWRGVAFVHERVLPPSESVVLPPGYCQCGVTRWGTHRSRNCGYYRRGSVVVEEWDDCYLWPVDFDLW